MEIYKNGFYQMMDATMSLYEIICTGESNSERERCSITFAKMVVRCANWACLAGLISKVDFCEYDPAAKICMEYNSLLALRAATNES